MSGSLAGITVVALEQAVAAPFATRQLADLGARVIKIERRETGDFVRSYDRAVLGESSYFVWLNRGKESIELDLKDSFDRAVLDLLLERADVFVQNLAPGAADRLGLDLVGLSRGNERLITCSISGYGRDGPYQNKKAYDLLIQCEAGVLAVTGTPEEMAKVGISIADIATGMYAYAGILTALYERERTGTGSSLEVSMLDALGEWASQPAYYFGVGSRPVERTGARHASISPYGPYRTSSGTVFIGVQNDREWAALCRDVLRRPDLIDHESYRNNVQRLAHDAELRTLIEEVLQDYTQDEVVAFLDEVGIANAVVRDPREFVDHPQLAARHRWVSVETPGGPVRALLPPVIVAGREDAPMRPVPALGQHSKEILVELGLSAAGSEPLSIWVENDDGLT